MIPEQLGPYRIARQLGRGGMGAVYEGVRDDREDENRRGAVKLLSPALADDPGFRERFAIEIETLKTLRHPNIVRLMAYGEQDGLLFYVMELIDGPSLEGEMRAGRRFTWRDVCRLGKQICDALQHAHNHGVIHRDLKPGNLLLASDTQIKLGDFGIARLFGVGRHTMHRGVMGTADYMAPEQAEGLPVSPAADLYSLGCVLYAMLAGRPPFRGGSVVEMLEKVRKEKPLSVRRWAEDVPRQLDALIDQLLAKKPTDRFHSAKAVGRALAATEKALSLAEASPSLPLPVEQDGEFTLSRGSSRVHHESTAVPMASPDSGALPGSNSPRDPLGETPTPSIDRSGAGGALEQDHVAKEGPEEVDAPRGDTPVDYPPADALPRPTRFVDIETEPEPAFESDDGWGRWAVAVVLLLFTLFVASGLFWLSQPPTAATLLARMPQAPPANDAGRQAAERAVEQFLRLYPDHPARDRVERFAAELELVRLERRILRGEWPEENAEEADADRALARIFAAAVRRTEAEPGLAAEQLAAMRDLLADDGGNALWPQLIERRLAAARTLADARRNQRRALFRQQRSRAYELLPGDIGLARQIHGGLTTLYADEPWAEAELAALGAAIEAADRAPRPESADGDAESRE